MDTNYYTKQLDKKSNSYKNNYDSAIKTLNELLRYIELIRISFVLPSGDSIEKIRIDLDDLSEDLSTEISNLKNALNKTLNRAFLANTVITNANYQNTSSFRDSKNVWELQSKKNYIGSDGIIYNESTYKVIPCESYDSLFGITAGIVKAFGGFETKTVTIYANPQDMMNGKLVWLGKRK